ncbi:hypothetical protein FZI85_17195 [Mycobacterium sp. CBMA293]|uniref:phage gene 29 protein family protein n=2 Tax=Mycolicibacterium TaxID=1866885 RepID=UPI0012DE2263|nr:MULTISPECIES: hypothetical protein [unclassified Mycolicibacterium]MUL44460.1 hypothetical protein [Mycolicibacterium sp. CBMA 360]MUL59780.1 hypothetical protein [Mycolicibacterium sp. CBMA 335]MUL68623.1 hypothetical protein [Mycolicibacterium sp. CBMA 311]MUL93986.1 hypothetical protein [Mycolicibacterium sp. CBMA 230]MUM06233.1 hypothetical protein [Mycolicibacterium sp. CBMA 213]
MTVSKKQNAYMATVMQQLLGDLQHPVGKDDSILYTEPFKAAVAWHLVRAGWRKPNNLDQFPLVEEFDDPVIKKRTVFGPGVMEDACEWVDASEPDDPLEHLDDMSMKQIEALPEHLRFEAKRRLGLVPAAPQPDPEQGWHVRPLVHITDAEEVGDIRSPEGGIQ